MTTTPHVYEPGEVTGLTSLCRHCGRALDDARHAWARRYLPTLGEALALAHLRAAAQLLLNEGRHSHVFVVRLIDTMTAHHSADATQIELPDAAVGR